MAATSIWQRSFENDRCLLSVNAIRRKAMLTPAAAATYVSSATQGQGDVMQRLGGAQGGRAAGGARPLYTPAEGARRDASGWTLVQGVLAPVQFLIFAVSLVLVVRCLATGDGVGAATWSVVAKTAALYAIMVTGAVWEKAVFGRYLFAPAFYWEDMFSMVVIALHTAYLGLLLAGIGTDRTRLFVALAAYAAYIVNATQFVLKLRAARLAAPAGMVAA